MRVALSCRDADDDQGIFKTVVVVEYRLGHKEFGTAAKAAAEALDIFREQCLIVGILRARRFRPSSASDFPAEMPTTVKATAGLERRTSPPRVCGEFKRRQQGNSSCPCLNCGVFGP